MPRTPLLRQRQRDAARDLYSIEARNWSQTDLAELFDVSRSAVQRVVAGLPKAAQQGTGHGLGAYAHGCRCAYCASCWRDYQRELRAYKHEHGELVEGWRTDNGS